MGFIQRAGSSSQPWGPVGALLGWTASRLQPDWAARLFQEDGETLVLTETDELSRAHCEDRGRSQNTPTLASGGTRTSATPDRTAATASPEGGQPSRTPATEESAESPRNANRPGNIKQVGPRGKQQITITLTAAGPRTTTSPSLLSHGDPRSCEGGGGTRYEAADPRADRRDTVSRVINSPTRSTKQSTRDSPRATRSDGLTGGKDARRWNQVIPEPDGVGGAAQTRPANVTGPREGPSLGLRGRGGEGGGVRGRGGEDGEEREEEEQRAQAHVPRSPPEEGQIMRGDGEMRRPVAGGATITTWEAGWNVTNAIQGMFVLGLPYALLRSGYLGLLLLVLAAWICNHTGNILVACLYEEEHPGAASSLASFLLLLPCLLLRDLKPVSTLSMLCSLAHALIRALLSYPLPFYSAAQILQTCLLRGTGAPASAHTSGSPTTAMSRPAMLVRGGLLTTSFLLALLVPRFSLLMGLTGSVTGAAMTLILPCLFHLRLHWRRLRAGERLTDVAILSLGLICSASGLVCSLKRLLEGLQRASHGGMDG
ncbi:hypothetical protein CRUP_037923 [Coryphaenoides rupestris]|nr:hypothetical protein CRUP_037923 [Coryphaenoides rupestris]